MVPAVLIPRPYQDEAVNSLFDYFTKKQTGNPVVAMPTGTGKAFVIVLFLQRAFAMYAGQKVLVATHVKELVDQNYKELMGIWPQAPAGIYSAGLNRKDTREKIIFCGIASIVKNIVAFGRVDLFIVDECHLISPVEESMYLRVITMLLAINPYMRVIGLTATPWRPGIGKITNGGIFTDICFDVTDMRSFNRFIREGYLAPLIAKRTETVLDTSGVHMRLGEFDKKELELAVNKDEITYAALQESIAQGHDRKHWLVFGSGVKHVKKITEMLNYLGISARCVHSNSKENPMTEKERDENIEDWKAGKYTAIVNNGILTTGVNFKAIDLIIMLRPTHSTILWVQMLGRGTRPFTEGGKLDCLVLDFAGNTKRLGPINDPVIPRKKGEPTGEVPIKVCEGCGTYNHISARYCGGEPFKNQEGCGMEFIFKVLIKTFASSEELIKADEPQVETFAVETVSFTLHKKMGSPDSIQVTYWCKVRKFTEYVLIEHEGSGQRIAREWWAARTTTPFPLTTLDALKVVDQLEDPTHIKVWLNTKFPKVLQVAFEGSFEKKIVGLDVPF